MTNLILVSHGKFSQGLRDALGMFVSDNLDSIKAIGLESGEGTSELVKKFEDLIDNFEPGTKLVVLGDIIGGSPLTTITDVLNQRNLLSDTLILGGMNFPMALNAAILKDSLELNDLSAAIIGEAQTAIRKYELKNDSDDEDDEI